MDRMFLEHLGATENETSRLVFPILNILFILFEFQCISASPSPRVPASPHLRVASALR